jgi:RNA polymerase sigma factor (sigma-70 family)
VVKGGNENISVLARKCQDGDKDAWKELIRRVTPMIFTICRKADLRHEENVDIFGQVCLLLLTGLKKIRSVDKLSAFVATTTWREILQLKRKSNLAKKSEARILESMYNQSVKRPDHEIEAEEISQILTEALLELPKRCFELIYALFFDGDRPSYREISKRLGIPVASVGPTRSRCLDKLLSILKRKDII